ncbi:hypothetical protein PCYB_004500, partial [Plasmodium cynomolgi strain B]
MSDDISDIEKWQGKYPFLQTVWDTYNEFDIPIQETDRGSENYARVCEKIVENYNELDANHKEFCRKLVRNLGCYNYKNEYSNPLHYQCHILYNWIYNQIKKYGELDDIITKCFNNCISLMNFTGVKHKCSYDLYNTVYKDPIKMTIIDIFNNNMQNIINKLIIEHEYDNEASAQNFLCEFVNLYKVIYGKHCKDKNERDTYDKITCYMLESFRDSYTYYFYYNEKIVKKYYIPSLYN